jgi:hypothetical protein
MVRMVPRIYKKKKWRIIVLWVLSSLFMFGGAMIAGQLQKTVGTNDIGFLIALVLSLVFFLTASLLWISIALALREIEEE